MTTPDTRPDTRPVLAQALDQAGRLVHGTDPADHGLPTPCGDWDVAALTSHLLAVVRRIGAILDGADPALLPRILDSAHPAADWDRERAATDSVLAADDVLDRVVTVPWGTVAGWQAIGSYAGELATHAWDLAVATGRVDQLDQSLAEAVLPSVRQFIPVERGEHIPFAPVVQVEPGASAYDQLVAWEGRDPVWSPTSSTA
jgi:uncharacterized protein (TIGR03086 family)